MQDEKCEIIKKQDIIGGWVGSNLGQVSHTRMLLSPSDITCYQSRGGDALRLAR